MTKSSYSADELADGNSPKTSRHAIYRAIRSGSLPHFYEKGDSVPRVKASDWASYKRG